MTGHQLGEKLLLSCYIKILNYVYMHAKDQPYYQ